MSTLEQVSLLAIYAAMASYTVSLLAFSIDLSSLRARRDETGAVIKGSRSARGRRSVDSALSGGGAAAGGDAASSVAVLDEPVADDAGHEEPPSSEVPRGKAVGIAFATLWLALGFHLAGVVSRGIAAGHVPWSNMYEFTISFTAVVVALYLWLDRKHSLRFLGAFVTLPVLLLLGVAVVVLYVQIDGLAPILDHYWLVIHVLMAILAIAIFAIAAILAVLQLVKDFGGGKGRIISHLPAADILERISYRFTAVGFVLWTFTLVAGAIWANEAWSRPWGWDAKEVWTFVIWVIYAAYLHARATRGWDGRRAATLVIVGFLAILANYFVVNFLLDTRHGYAF